MCANVSTGTGPAEIRVGRLTSCHGTKTVATVNRRSNLPPVHLLQFQPMAFRENQTTLFSVRWGGRLGHSRGSSTLRGTPCHPNAQRIILSIQRLHCPTLKRHRYSQQLAVLGNFSALPQLPVVPYDQSMLSGPQLLSSVLRHYWFPTPSHPGSNVL